MTRKESNILLFSITLCWACAYIFIKALPADLSSYAYLALTSGIAGVIMLAVFHRSMLRLHRSTVLKGMVLAILITGDMLFEKKGLEFIPSSTASFLASLNIMVVPLILLLFRKFPTKNNVAGILIILAGLFIANGVALTNGSIHGVLYMLGACVMMSLYTIVAAEFTKKSDPLQLSVLQICFSAVIGFILCFWENPHTFVQLTWSKQMLSSIFILAFFSKAYAYIMLMYAEKYADAISVTVIASTEPVVTLLLALLIPNMQEHTEDFSMRTLLGAVAITMGAIVAGTDFLRTKNRAEASGGAILEKHTKKTVEPAQIKTVEPAQTKTVEPAQAKTVEPAQTKTVEPAQARAVEPAQARAVEPVQTRAEGRKRKNDGKKGAGLFLRRFLLCMVPFAVLGAAFKVMVLVEGFTEVRPANAIPVAAGLILGPAGGLGCAVGNLIADCFGSMNLTSLLGMAGNFMAAYIPYRMWYALRTEKPNAHTWKNLLLYIWASCLSALSCAWILGFGLELFFGLWIDTVYKYVLLNNLGFSLALGLPIFILMTSDSFSLKMCRPGDRKSPLWMKKWTVWILAAETVILAVIMAGIYTGQHLSNSVVMQALSVFAAVLLVGICMLPVRKDDK